MKGVKNVKKYLKLIFFLFIIPLSFFPHLEVRGDNELVYHAKIDNEVTKGLYAYLERAVKGAEDDGAKAIIFEIDTYGGSVIAADDIGKLLNNTKLRTIAYINPNAISAGAFIALNMDEIYMSPTAKIGSAKVITSDGNAADEKSQSFWLAAMKTAAEQNGRDPIYAMAMVDSSIELPDHPNFSFQDGLLTLTSSQALEVGYSEGIVNSFDELIQKLGFETAEIKPFEKTLSNWIAEFVTNSYVVPILLSIGSLGLIIELYSPGFGFPGFMGVLSLLLFFYGHMIAGLAGLESIILFVLGIILLVIELFVPGGILGFLGFGSIILSILLAGENVYSMAINLIIAILVAVMAMVILVKIFKKRIRLFDKIVLKDATTTEQGYISNQSRTDLLNRTGITITPLRPSGTIMIDNERIDAVTEGGFIAAGSNVQVVEVEGVRVVVREIKD